LDTMLLNTYVYIFFLYCGIGSFSVSLAMQFMLILYISWTCYLLNRIPQNPRISRGLQALPELLDLYATLLDFTCHYTSDSVCVYIFILALLYLRLLKILPYIRTVDIHVKLVFHYF
jgi:hypothetical protein